MERGIFDIPISQGCELRARDRGPKKSHVSCLMAWKGRTAFGLSHVFGTETDFVLAIDLRFP